MQGSKDRILTTHVGSLPRTLPVLDAMKARFGGDTFDDETYQAEIVSGVNEIVKRQADLGIDIVTDGEMSKPGFMSYVEERIDGFEARPNEKYELYTAEVEAFPEYYADYMERTMYGAAVAKFHPIYCTGPISYKGQAALKRDLDTLSTALDTVDVEGAVVPSVSPAGIGANDFYRTDEEFFEAVADAIREEYEAICNAGFLVQIDDPFLSEILVDPALDDAAIKKRANLVAEAVNHATRNIPREKIRYHTCYGINEGPRLHEAPLAEVAPYLLRIKAGGYSFEAANPRHEHEYHIWEDIKLPEGSALLPGVVTHASNIVEHPDLIAERIIRFADRVGRENVIASTACGFSSQACYHTEIHPTVIWAKFEALAEGARRATQQLW
jgi:5-methyltetrahydropteroyltriglutamate--homocysteine methyltransferase